MKYTNPILLVLFIGLFTQSTQAQAPSYIEEYKAIAVQEMNRSGIPASIIMAQAIVESAWGKGSLAFEANNHFGIKCKSTWEGSSYFLEDDDYNAAGDLIESCFRAYPDALSSFRDHTDFLMNNARYQSLFDLHHTDYISWAKGLKTCGYATDKQYAEKLIRKIEQYGLGELDVLEIPLDAPTFEIPYQEESKIEEATTTKAVSSTSLIIDEDFGLIQSTTNLNTASKKVILEAPIYQVEVDQAKR